MINGQEDSLEYSYRVFASEKRDNDYESGARSNGKKRGFWTRLFGGW
jgi:hypothetical protein